MWRKSPDLIWGQPPQPVGNPWEEWANISSFCIKDPTIWVGYLSTTNVPVEDCGNVPLLGLTSSSRPASVAMFDVKLSCSEGDGWRFYSGCVIHIEWVLLIVELLSGCELIDFRVRFWFGVVADFVVATRVCCRSDEHMFKWFVWNV